MEPTSNNIINKSGSSDSFNIMESDYRYKRDSLYSINMESDYSRRDSLGLIVTDDTGANDSDSNEADSYSESIWNSKPWRWTVGRVGSLTQVITATAAAVLHLFVAAYQLIIPRNWESCKVALDDFAISFSYALTGIVRFIFSPKKTPSIEKIFIGPFKSLSNSFIKRTADAEKIRIKGSLRLIWENPRGGVDKSVIDAAFERERLLMQKP